MQGENIKIRLVRLHLTQRWLLHRLQHKGFAGLHEPHFSDILNGVYTSGNATEVLDAAERALDEYESPPRKEVIS